MQKELIKKLKTKLEKEKKQIEEELSTFAKKDKRLKGDWDTLFPQFDSSSSGTQSLEDAAGEVEEYTSKLPVEYTLELRLKDIDAALEKIKNGSYGKCEKCGKKISINRLKVKPESLFCIKCQR